MESRHVDPTSFLTSGYMDPQTTGQMRPPYSELCRPPGTDTSALSAYHSRYLPSMPLSTGTSFPFLGGMFTGSLPGPPTSPFRTPSNPGVNNMRQFWPPTPPPDGGYGRLALNANLFPLFGAPPDNGAFLTQGLVSRLGSATHLSPLIDHKEHSFFSHGIGLGTPLTPTSHVTSPSPYPHLIPSLERHPAYSGHMTLGSKELEDLQQEADDARLIKGHLDCLMNPSSRLDRPKLKNEAKHCCDKTTLDECCKLLQDNEKLVDDARSNSNKTHSRQPTNKVQPCKIEVSHSPSLKPDLLSPPIESPKSPNKTVKKSTPLLTDSVTNSDQKEQQTRCSQCCANIKDAKLNVSESTEIPTESVSEPVVVLQSSHGPVSSIITPVSTPVNVAKNYHLQETTGNVENKSTHEKELGGSSVITVTDVNDKSSLDETLCSSNKNTIESPSSKLNNSMSVKHVTAAVIPTAPKQTVHRDIHPESANCSTNVHELPSRALVNTEQSAFDQKKNYTDNCVKLESVESCTTEKASTVPNIFSCSVNGSFSNKCINKSSSTNCKVKDMIKNTCNAKQLCIEKSPGTSPSKNTISDSNEIVSMTPTSKVVTGLSTVVNPIVVSKSPCKSNGKFQCLPIDSGRRCNLFKEDSPSMKTETVNSRLDCECAQKSNSNWTKATVSPFNWQGNSSQDEQAINLTVSKRTVKPEPSEVIVTKEMIDTNSKIPTESVTTSSGIIGVCHPNPTPIAMNKVKGPSSVSSISNYSSISVLNQPIEQSTEVHILHRSSKSSFPLVNRNGTSPVPLKSTISHVTANTSIHRSLKTERLIAKRGKISEMDKISHSGGRTTLATLAPKLSKNVNFGKDVQTSHTISASSSVSSTSIVFPATVNPCIPVGIAIAQQRQDTSTNASIAKSQSSVPSSTPNILSTNAQISSNRVTADLQTQEVLREQKGQDLPINNNPTPVDTNLLVTQGPAIVSRQWESEALTRTALPSWVAHGSIVAPAVWLGQGAYTAPVAPAPNAMPSVAVNPLESSPISLPPGGYQLARDSITGHLLLIPTANIELMDRSSVWPAFNSSAGTMPIQQLVTQQQHTQFEQVLPQSDSLKTGDSVESTCNVAACDITNNTSIKTDDKMEDVSGQVPSVPLATGQTYAFTTFPTQCDPAGFSYVLQSSTVMHLAHTQTTASIQTESGRRSQATSPLHCATPSPPPNTCSVQVSVMEDEESDNESDAECCDGNQVSGQSQSVTMAIQVDMDSQTNSEEDEEEDGKVMTVKPEAQKMNMCDSANQTETVECDSPKSQTETEFQCEKVFESPSSPPPHVKTESSAIGIKKDIELGLEIETSEAELAPSLPVESKPVMDFIDHHGLNLLVDSIEEFASREQESHVMENDIKVEVISNSAEQQSIKEKISLEVKPNLAEVSQTLPTKSFTSPYKTIDTTCTDGLGLLCALAEQRFLEEALNDDSKTKPQKDSQFFSEKQSSEEKNLSIAKENSFQSNSSLSSADSSLSSSPSHREATEMEMRLQIEELQKKYKQKQRELELLRNKKEKEMNDEDAKKVIPSCAESPDILMSKQLESPSADSLEETSKVTTKENDSFQDPVVVQDEMNKSDNLSDISSNSSEEPKNKNAHSVEKRNVLVQENEKSKTPFFDEQAWFVRRSERIFLSDTRTPIATDKSNKKQSNSPNNKGLLDISKDKKENPSKLKSPKSADDTSVRKNKSKVLKPKKKQSLSTSSDSDASSDEKFSEVESSDAASCTSENLPLSTFVEHSSSNKVSMQDRPKRMSLDSESSSGQSEDTPLSILLENKMTDIKSCILHPEDLQENARLLVLDEGLFYAGYITKSEDPDLYGILIDGDRAARPHMFSKEEILNAAVLEVKPTHKLQLPEGSRICAFWSQQYRCLYPGTVTKASSPLTDPSLLFVEFDDGDSGRIPLNDIRMLPSDFPIVSMEPNPFMILGKRRSRAHSQNNVSGMTDVKSDNVLTSLKNGGDKTETKKLKNLEKIVKRNLIDDKVIKGKKSRSKSPCANSRSRSSSKSSVSVHSDSKLQNLINKKESTAEKKQLCPKMSHLEKKSKDSCSKSIMKPKKHKKRKDDHHKHHHHHHKHHHHKKHKVEKSQEYDSFILKNSKSDFTMKFKKSPSPHTNNHEELKKSPNIESSSSSSDDEDLSEPPPKKQKKLKLHSSPSKPSKRKDRVPSVEKSKIAAFLPVRQLWRWSGKSYRRPGAKGKAKKEFYRSIQRGKEAIKVGDCAVFLSTGRPHLPYIGRIETMWESWGGKMDVKVKWFYHPEETKSGKKLSQLKGALFQSPHFDENDVQTISHKCEVLSWGEYQQKMASKNIEDNNDTYFLAGTYDPIMGTLILEPGVPNICSTSNTSEP